MKKTMIVLAALLALGVAPAFPVASTFAAETTQAEKDALTVEQVLNVTAGLNQLLKYETTDKDGKPFTAFYDLSADTRITIAVNIDLGRRAQTSYQNAQNELVMAWVDPATGKVPENKINAFNVESTKLMQAPSRVGFIHIKKEELKLEKNNIPGPVLSLIIPILDR